MCTCHADVNAKLKPLNGRLATGFTYRDGDGETKPCMDITLLMQVEKIVSRGRKPPLVLPTFCPFCGEKLISTKASPGVTVHA